MRGLPSCSTATQTSRAACPCCLGRVQHRMGIYLNKGAKAGCSSRNRGPTSHPGPGTFPWASQGIRLPGTQSLRNHWSRSRSAPVSRWYWPGAPLGPPAPWGGLVLPPICLFQSQKVQESGMGAWERSPEPLVLGLDHLRICSEGCCAQ